MIDEEELKNKLMREEKEIKITQEIAKEIFKKCKVKKKNIILSTRNHLIVRTVFNNEASSCACAPFGGK